MLIVQTLNGGNNQMNQKPLTMSFVATPELKRWLEQQAAKDERSVSYILRKLLEREANREATRQQVTPQRAN